MRILVTTPTYEGMVKAGMHDATANLERCGHDLEFRSVSGYACDRARTAMAKIAIDGCYDYALFVDSDVVVPPDALANMLEHGALVVLGYYPRQGRPDVTCLFRDEGKPGHDSPFTAADIARMRDAGCNLFEVKGGGLGCALIRTDVFGKIAEPWFRYVTYKDGGHLSEDLWFCKQCREAGIKVRADARVACGHYARNLVRM